MNDRERTLHLSPVQVVAGAMASVTAAVLASFFGVAGTIIGAGVMSAAGSVGNALYSYWIRSTRQAIRGTIPSALRQQVSTVRTLVGAGVHAGGPPGSSGDDGTAQGGSDPDNTNEVPALDRPWDVPPPGPFAPPPTSLGPPPTAPGPPPAPEGAPRRDVRAWLQGLWPAALSVARSLRWRNIALATVVVFGVSMGVVTAVEALAKKPLSGIVGGSTPAGATTSLGGLVGGQSSRNTPAPPPSETTTTNPETTTPNGSSTTTTSPSTGSTTPGRSTTTTTPPPTTPTVPGLNGTSPGSGSSSGATSSGSSSGSSASGSSASGTGSGTGAPGSPSTGG